MYQHKTCPVPAAACLHASTRCAGVHALMCSEPMCRPQDPVTLPHCRYGLSKTSSGGEFLTSWDLKLLCPAGALAELRSLDLSNNQLTGSLPAGLARPALESVRLSNNLLAGEHNLIHPDAFQLLAKPSGSCAMQQMPILAVGWFSTIPASSYIIYCCTLLQCYTTAAEHCGCCGLPCRRLAGLVVAGVHRHTRTAGAGLVRQSSTRW